MEEFSQSQRSVAQQMVEQEGDGVAQDLPEQPACQVPQIACPHPLYAIAPHELREDGIYAVAKPAQQSAFLRRRFSLFLEE